MGWASRTNGDLFQLAADHGFDAVITTDRNIEYQQNLETLPVPIVLMIAFPNRLEFLRPLVPGVVELLNETLQSRIYRVTV